MDQKENYTNPKPTLFETTLSEDPLYKGCAPSFEKGKGPLCATEVDEKNNLKKWARCNEFCKLDSGM